jgi:predicted RNA-binding protein YlqC (UPF0109 family)
MIWHNSQLPSPDVRVVRSIEVPRACAMDEFISYLIKNLVSHPDQVDVRSQDGERGLLVQIRVAGPDIPKVVGKQGNTIKALRTIAITAGARIGRRVRLELVEDRVHNREPAREMIAPPPSPTGA